MQEMAAAELLRLSCPIVSGSTHTDIFWVQNEPQLEVPQRPHDVADQRPNPPRPNSTQLRG